MASGLNREELTEALKELLTVEVEIDREAFSDYHNIKVKLLVDGEVISTNYDSVKIPEVRSNDW